MSVINWNILYINDPLKGRPLFGGKIFVGTPDLDPEIVINQKQLNVIQDDGTVVAVPQPFILSAGGVPMYNGSTVRLDVDGNYSIKVLDRNDSQVYFIDNIFEGQPVTVADLPALTDSIIYPIVETSIINDLSQAYEFDTWQLMKDSTIAFDDGKPLVTRQHTAGTGYGGTRYTKTTGSSPESIGSPNLTGGGYAAIEEKDTVTATEYGLILGVQATELPSQNAVIAVLIATRKYVEFGEGVVWIDTPVVIDIGTATGDFWEGTGYGQKFISNRTTFSARTDFVGDELVELAAPDCGIQGWVNFQCNDVVKHGCKMTGAQTQIPEGGRTYGWTQSGIFIDGRFGQQVGPFQGASGTGGKALIEANDNTGIKITSPQMNRATTGVYLLHFTSTFDFTVIGGTPDKCDEGVFISLSQGKWLGGNLEGVKRPLFIDRSWVEFSGRMIGLGGLALSPENSTTGASLDIGDDATRRAGTSLIVGKSARVRLPQVIGTNWDFENDLDFTDLSGSNSNELYMGQVQENAGNFENCIIPQTMVIDGDEDTELVSTDTDDYLVRGPGSGTNQIVPDTTLLKSGFDISFDGLWYVVQVTGVYEIELTCDLEADIANPASTVVFTVLNKNLNDAVYSTPTMLVPANPNGEPIIIRFKSNLGVGNGYRMQGVTDAMNNRALLKNLSLKIKRIGNIV